MFEDSELMGRILHWYALYFLKKPLFELLDWLRQVFVLNAWSELLPSRS
ncbi:MAG: hypothetical protein AB9M53_10470 [Leptothrix sp. (in: b-proteobacteria)]